MSDHLDDNSSTHLNDYAKALLGHRYDWIIREGDSTYDTWTLDCHCGDECKKVLIAAVQLHVMLRDASERERIIPAAIQQCRVICYG